MHSKNMLNNKPLITTAFTAMTLALVAPTFLMNSANAAGPVVKSNTNVPVTNTVFVPCANNGQGDTIQLSGTLHELIFVTLDNNGGFLLHITANGQDVTGVSTTTGVSYHVGVGDSTTLIGRVGSVQTFTNSFVLVDQGTAANLIIHFDGHLTVNPNGTVTVSFDRENIQCM
jgi:hypothetical protein